MFWVVVALLYFVLAVVAPSILGLFVNRARPDFRTLSLSLRVVFVAIALICLAATSYVHVDSDEIAVFNKIYGTTSLPGEHIIATNGEKGPQAEILTPGWHPWFLVNVIYQVENKKVVSIPSGKYGFLNAKDGAPLRPDQFLADAFPAEHQLDMLDAEYFLTHGGQRGPLDFVGRRVAVIGTGSSAIQAIPVIAEQAAAQQSVRLVSASPSQPASPTSPIGALLRV